MTLQLMCEPDFGDDYIHCPIFPEQLEPAYRLARHFDHAWADGALAAFPKSCRFRYPDGHCEDLTTEADIRSVTPLEHQTQIPTNIHAFLHYRPAGGTLEWTVWDDGRVWFWCFTPSGSCCLEAIVSGTSPCIQLQAVGEGDIRTVTLPPIVISTKRAQAPFTATELSVLEEAIAVLLDDTDAIDAATQPFWRALRPLL